MGTRTRHCSTTLPRRHPDLDGDLGAAIARREPWLRVALADVAGPDTAFLDDTAVARAGARRARHRAAHGIGWPEPGGSPATLPHLDLGEDAGLDEDLGFGGFTVGDLYPVADGVEADGIER